MDENSDNSNSSVDNNELNFLELNLPREHFTACPVKRGSLVILDGSTVHFSDPNFTNEHRYTYTFRIMETDYENFVPENWFQLSEGEQIACLY